MITEVTISEDVSIDIDDADDDTLIGELERRGYEIKKDE